MEDIRDFLTASAREYGVEVTSGQAALFQSYLELLTEWNEKVNLTAITEPREVAVKHFLDSILLVNDLELTEGKRLIDIGTGAGFPGLPLKIIRPGLELTLLDGLNKRLLFLQEALKTLKLTAETVHFRAEEAGRREEYRAQFDFATARAVAPLNLLCEYCLPFLKIGGTFAAMKGPNSAEEIGEAQRAIRLLGCEPRGVREFTLPGGDRRSLILITRVAPVPELYPRHGSKIAKKPL